MKRFYLKLKKRHKIAAIVTGVLLLLILVGGSGGTLGVEAIHPDRRSMSEIIPAGGRLQPVTDVRISPDISGEVVDIFFNEGDSVKEGDVLIRIRQDSYISSVERSEAALNATRAQYLQCKAQLAKAEGDFTRSRALMQQNAISRAEFENSQAEFEVAKERLRAAQYSVRSDEAALKEASGYLDRTSIKAPISGTVTAIFVEKGEMVAATSQMAGTELLRITDFSRMEVVVNIGENDVVHIKRRDTATIVVDAWPGKTILGTVTHVAEAAGTALRNQNSAVTGRRDGFEVRIELIPDSYRDLTERNPVPLRPGMSASVSIFSGHKENALSIPMNSIVIVDNLEAVWTIIDNKSLSLRSVTTGLQEGGRIEILSGLSEDDLVVANPATYGDRLEEGRKVNIK